MKLQDLAGKPQLREITIEDPTIVERYGEPLVFFVYDRLSVDTYTRLATIKSDDPGVLYDLVKDLILDESGAAVITGDHTLPTDVMTAAIMRVTEELGK